MGGIKAQQMNMGQMNIQPVIIDSNHFNNADKQQQALASPGKSMQQQMSNNLTYKTQKFSKIQLQAIIDNLYQYDSKGQKINAQSQQVRGTAEAAANDLAKTITFKNGVQANAQMHLPEVNSNDNIHKQGNNNIANRALNAVSQQKTAAAAAVQANIIGLHHERRSNLAPASSTDVRNSKRLGSSGGQNQAKSQSQEMHILTAGQGRF